ncbi:MAG: DUF1631 family protein [Betaproteobacteria bacterium]|nr:DUF1631 family protein [Betaproteobacteria bacterium]
MVRPPPSPAYLQYIDDELLRAPLLFDQLAEGTVDALRRSMAKLGAADRAATSDLLKGLNTQKARLAEIYTRTLREQADVDRVRAGAAPAMPLKPARSMRLALVEEDEVAADVELSHTIEYIKTHAEHELRELRTYVAALVGDFDVSADHNPFRPEVHAKALWTAAQALPASRGWQMHFMRQATPPLAAVLRQAYAAASSRLESMGIEPASYRTVISPGGSRRSAGVETTYTPDLYRMRDSMAAPLDEATPLRYEGQHGTADVRRESWADVARQAPNRLDRQAIELVSRLFEAIVTDERVPPDVILLISRLHGPAMRLTLRDAGVLDQQSHPLWRFIHLVTYEAEMAPDTADPERRRLLRLAQQLIDQIAAEPDQRPTIYRRAVLAVEDFLRQRLQRRLTGLATQVGVLQKLEHQALDGGDGGPDTIGGMVDLPVMDTVPADVLVEAAADPPPSGPASGVWLASLEVGTWVRLYLSGRWVHAQLLWIGERGEVWLFGDGASDTTWAVRRGALLRLHGAALAKTLTMRSLLGRAALKVQQQVAVQGAR